MLPVPSKPLRMLLNCWSAQLLIIMQDLELVSEDAVARPGWYVLEPSEAFVVS